MKHVNDDDFSSETPTQPIPKETLLEVRDRWVAERAGIATSERPTVNIRPLGQKAVRPMTKVPR